MIVLHYTGMQFSHEAIHRLCDTKARVSSHYVVLETGSIVQLVPGGQARLACRRVELGRRHRHQFALDRDRDLQSRPRIRLSGFSVAADRGDDHAVPLDPDAQHHPAGKHRGAFRRGAGRKQDPGEKFPWKLLAQSGVGLWVEAGAVSTQDRCSPTTAAARSPSCRGCWRNTATASSHRPLRRRHHRGGHRVPAPFPSVARSTASPTPQRCRHCGSS